jgi:thioredoxin-related protein
MFTCKQVSHALSKEDYMKLSPTKRFFLKLHVKLCIFCGKFNRQVMENQDMCRHYREHEAACECQHAHAPELDEKKKAELKAMLAAHSAAKKSE